MIKGKWVIIGVLGVALAMGFASWPLMKIRRKNELHRTKEILRGVDIMCRQYQAEHRKPPQSLNDLRMYGAATIVDGWQRPVQFRAKEGGWELWSLGPNPDDPSDDIR